MDRSSEDKPSGAIFLSAILIGEGQQAGVPAMIPVESLQRLVGTRQESVMLWAIVTILASVVIAIIIAILSELGAFGCLIDCLFN